jgi:2-methylcitrate dehydratase PrpD
MQSWKSLTSLEPSEGDSITRRALLKVAGTFITVPASANASAQDLPSSSQAKTNTSRKSVMPQLSAYMSEAAERALPDEATEKAKEHVLDTVASMVSGSALVPGRSAIDFVREYGGKRIATVIGSDLLCGSIQAALANAIMAHADETDDSHAPSQSHPGCAVVPAALAAGEHFGADGTHFLRAVALGYDVGPRFTVTLGGERYETESHWSTHSIATLFGAAAAAGSLARLNAQQMQVLLGYTVQQCSGLASWHRDSQHVQKAFVFAGMPARNGLTSALLVEAGWTGVEDLLSGVDNFFEAFNPHADPEGLIDKLGERYEITRTNIKKWTVGSPIQAALDAIEILQKQHPFTAGQVQQVTVQLATDEAAIVNNREMPDINLQYMVAVMLMDKTASFTSAHDMARMKDPATLREIAKVKLVPSDELQNEMPLRVAIVDIVLSNGMKLSKRVDNVRGTPENPMTREEIVNKARDLMDPVLGAATSAKLMERILNLEQVKDIRELRPLLQRA